MARLELGENANDFSPRSPLLAHWPTYRIVPPNPREERKCRPNGGCSPKITVVTGLWRRNHGSEFRNIAYFWHKYYRRKG